MTTFIVVPGSRIPVRTFSIVLVLTGADTPRQFELTAHHIAGAIRRWIAKRMAEGLPYVEPVVTTGVRTAVDHDRPTPRPFVQEVAVVSGEVPYIDEQGLEEAGLVLASLAVTLAKNIGISRMQQVSLADKTWGVAVPHEILPTED